MTGGYTSRFATNITMINAQSQDGKHQRQCRLLQQWSFLVSMKTITGDYTWSTSSAIKLSWLTRRNSVTIRLKMTSSGSRTTSFTSGSSWTTSKQTRSESYSGTNRNIGKGNSGQKQGRELQDTINWKSYTHQLSRSWAARKVESLLASAWTRWPRVESTQTLPLTTRKRITVGSCSRSSVNSKQTNWLIQLWKWSCLKSNWSTTRRSLEGTHSKNSTTQSKDQRTCQKRGRRGRQWSPTAEWSKSETGMLLRFLLSTIFLLFELLHVYSLYDWIFI